VEPKPHCRRDPQSGRFAATFPRKGERDFDVNEFPIIAEIDAALDTLLPTGGRLAEAMRYAALAPGKRLRPFLTLETGKLLALEPRDVIRAACAVELIHAYSLVHDDLPCMDDDDLRRGRPTVHRQFDEATAVLTGDALQSLAFEVLADPLTHADGAVRADLTLCLARAAGAGGMASGQMLDLRGEGPIEAMQALKTGALIGAAVEVALIIGQVADRRREALMAYAADLGLLFQIADDILDAEGTTETLGKAAGKDSGAGKANLVTRQGVEAARRRGEDLVKSAKARLDLFGEAASSLQNAADFVLHRRS